MDIERLIESYHPPKPATQLIEDTQIMLLVGISGAGKETIKKALLAKPGYGEIISHTTRPPRQNEGVIEKNGVDYHFVSNTAAHDMLIDGEFVEAKLVHGDTVYGSSIAEVRRAGEAGIALTDLDVQGLAEYKAISDKVIAIFIIPPTFDEWIRRLRRRYATEEEFNREWPKRRQFAISELEKALGASYYRCVVNSDLKSSVAAIEEIARRPDLFTRQDDEARLVARDLLRNIKM